MTFNTVLEEIFTTQYTYDINKNKLLVNDGISRDEAFALYNTFKKTKAAVTIEVGLAHGISALVFCQAHKESNNTEGVHYAVDPNQLTSYNSAAICALEKAGYLEQFKLLNGPSHLEIPELIKQNVKIDCAFIDGWHTFDYTIIDFFLIDKLLKPGGYVAFHDTYGRSKQKVINFILTHRKYEIDNTLMNFSTEPFLKIFKFFIWRIYKDPMLLFSWFHWKYQLRSSSGLIILKKVKDFEPNYDFFNFF